MLPPDILEISMQKPRGKVQSLPAHLHEEDEVLEGGVEVSLLLQPHHRVEVLVVDVGVDPEQPLQDGLGHRHEVLGEGDA